MDSETFLFLAARVIAFASHFVIFICSFFLAFKMRADDDDCAIEFVSRFMCGFWALMAILGMWRAVDVSILDWAEVTITAGFALLMLINVFCRKGLADLVNFEKKD